jgi:hypothetical protein
MASKQYWCPDCAAPMAVYQSPLSFGGYRVKCPKCGCDVDELDHRLGTPPDDTIWRCQYCRAVNEWDRVGDVFGGAPPTLTCRRCGKRQGDANATPVHSPTTGYQSQRASLPQVMPRMSATYHHPTPSRSPARRASDGLRAAASATVGFTRVMFATALMLSVGAGVLLGGVALGQWLALSVLPGVVPYAFANLFTFLTPAFSMVLFALYLMPFIWDRVGGSRRFGWSSSVSRSIGTLGEGTRMAVAGGLILTTGYAIAWGGVLLGEHLATQVLQGLVPDPVAALAVYVVPALGLALLVLYVAPWIWDRATDRDATWWAYRARKSAGRLLRALIAMLLILAALAVILMVMLER